MKSSGKLDPVIRVARENEQTAARVLARSQAELVEAEQRLAELAAYRDEYVTGLEHKTNMGLNALQVRDYRAFLERLDAAIEQQQGVVTAQRQSVELNRTAWLSEKQRLGALDKLVLRKTRQAQRDEDRREQLDNNEQALTRWRRASN